MSAFPRDPEHFFRWVRRHHDAEAQPQDFVPRHVYGTYVETLLETVADYPGNARLERRHDRVLAVDRRGDRFVVRLAQGESVVARSVVLATGSRSGTDWAPPGLAGTPRLVADPWHQALPDGDLLLVGTGLSMVDVAIGADRPGRTLHTVSRHDEIPRVHRVPTTPAAPPPPGVTRVATVEELHAGPRPPPRGDHDADRGLASGDRRPAPRHRAALGRPRRGGQAQVPRRARPHLGRPPSPDAAGHRPPARRDRPRRAPGAPPRRAGRRPAGRRRRRGRRSPTAPRSPSRPSSTAPARSARSRTTRCSPGSPAPGWCAPDLPGSASTPPTTAGCWASCPPRCRSSRSAPCAAATCGRPRRCRRSASRPTTSPRR